MKIKTENLDAKTKQQKQDRTKPFQNLSTNIPLVLIFLITLLTLSATYTFPLISTAKLLGLSNLAEPTSPSSYPGNPFPENLLKTLSATEKKNN